MTDPRYDGRKFRELMIYLAERCRIDPKFGDTKFQKLLYWIDFGAYRKLGAPITGAAYKRFQHGPVAEPFWRERETLMSVGAVEVESRGFFGKKQKVTRAKRTADLSVFTSNELELIEEVVAQYQHYSASDVRTLSHLEAGWQLTNEKEVIPYETVLIEKGPLPPSVQQKGSELLQRYGW
jgi:uncharacterized phage-associated protein